MKRMLTGIQPSNILTLGNYIGAIKPLIELQNELTDTEIFVFIADLHAISSFQDKTELRKRIKELAAIYLASGLDPKRANLFIQSEVLEHTALSYIMESTAYIGEMERMTQYKDKKVKQLEGVRTSLLTYPALMAADILLYDTNLVPVGKDQKQHLELTRHLAERFNNTYGETFTIPDAHIRKTGSNIKSLVDPLKKMSKSDENPKSYILLLDDINVIKNKIKSAVTDSDTKIIFDEKNKPGISNLLTIYSVMANKSIKDIEAIYKDKTYKDFKEDLADIVSSNIKIIQDNYNNIMDNKDYLDQILDEGAKSASLIARKKLSKVYQEIGLGRKR